jgi:hypothetical protein
MRWVVCLLSLALLNLIGRIGDEAFNLPYYVYGDLRHMDAELPYWTDLVVHSYYINHGDFELSLTPAMILLLGLAVGCHVYAGVARNFWYLFVTVWLLVGIYVCMYALALLLPFHLLLSVVGPSPVDTIVPIINGVLTVALVIVMALGIRSRLRERRACHSTGEDGGLT